MSVDIEMCGMLVNGLSVPLQFNRGLCNKGVWRSYGCLHVLLLDCTGIDDFIS